MITTVAITPQKRPYETLRPPRLVEESPMDEREHNERGHERDRDLHAHVQLLPADDHRGVAIHVREHTQPSVPSRKFVCSSRSNPPRGKDADQPQYRAYWGCRGRRIAMGCSRELPRNL